MNDQNRRRDDSHPDQPLDWQSDALHPEYRRPVTQAAIDGAKKEVIDAGMTLLALERIEAAVLPIPDTKPKLWAAIGPLEGIRRLLSYEEPDSAGAARQGGATSKESGLAAPQAGAGKVEVPIFTDEQINDILEAAYKRGELRWAGFEKDSEDRYCRPSLSACHFDLFRAAVKAASPAAPVAEKGQSDDNLGAKLHGTMDAQVWATEFCRLNNAADHGMMLAWFANAIMAGYDHAKREAPPATGEGQQQDEDLGAVREQASAWLKVYWLLSELRPGFYNKGASGMESALIEIRELAQQARASLSSPAERQEAEPCKPTDLSAQLRDIAKNYGTGEYLQVRPQMLNAAAEEIERYYGGMLAWKRTAEKKDRDWNEELMARVDERCAARVAAPSGEIGTVDTPEFRAVMRKLLTAHDQRMNGPRGIALIAHINQYAAQVAKAEREKALEEATFVVQKCFVSIGQPDDPHPDAVTFNGAVYDCANAIKALRTPQPAADTEQGAK